MRCDFHLHTTMSDGTATPEALAFRASARDLDVIAVTDHDTTEGCAAAISEGEEVGVRVIPGVELSARLSVPGDERASSIHLICLGFDVADAALQRMLAGIRASRVRASNETAERLALAGFPVELGPAVPGRSLARPHLARALVRAGHAGSRNQAFDRFLAGDAFRSDYELPSAGEAIAAVHRAGGVAIWAHPDIELCDRAVPVLVDQGLDGLEVRRASFARSPRPLYIRDWARRAGLLESGGSDWHGNGILGTLALGREEVPELVDRLL